MLGAMGRARLTPKQERFARHIALDEMSQADAYRSAYDVSNPRSPAIYVESSNLVRHPNVALRIDELTRQAAASVGVTPEWALSKVKRAADELFESVEQGETGVTAPLDAKTGVQLLRLAADMLGWIPKGTAAGDDLDRQRADVLRQLASLGPDALRAAMAMPIDAILASAPSDQADTADS